MEKKNLLQNRFFRAVQLVITGLLLLLTLLLTNLEFYAFNLDYYQDQFQKLDRPAATGMEEEELLRVTGEMIDYLQGEREDLALQAQIHRQQVPLFTQRELDHMVDVQELFLEGIWVRRMGALLLVVSLLLGLLMYSMPPLRALAYILSRGALLGLVIMAMAGIAFVSAFDFWFDVFHFVSFDNDLWLLDPSRHNLIRMFPQEFFRNTTLAFVGRTLAQLGIISLVGFLFTGKRKGKGSR